MEKNADGGVWVLIIIVFLLGLASYHYEVIGSKWTKVLEIVGAPFSLGLGFFAFEKGAEVLNNYREKHEKE